MRARRSGERSSSAAGTTSEKMRAPCDPPVTRSLSLPSVKAGKAMRAASITAGRTGLPVWTAFGPQLFVDAAAAAEIPSRSHRRAGRGSDWRDRSRHSARAGASARRAASPRTPAARSDNRRNRRRRAAATSPMRPRAAKVPRGQHQGRTRLRQERAAGRRRGSDPVHGARRKGSAILQRARVRRELDRKAAPRQRNAQSFGGKEMAPRAARSDEDRAVLFHSGSILSMISASGRLRVTATRNPMPSASEISEEPP